MERTINDQPYKHSTIVIDDSSVVHDQKIDIFYCIITRKFFVIH